MARQWRIGRGCAVLGVALAALFFVFPLHAGQPPVDPVLRAQLESGEFAPALEGARRLANPQERDAV